MLKTVVNGQKYNLNRTGYDKNYQLHAENITLNNDNTSFDVVTLNGKKHRFSLNMIGEHNVLNALLGIQVSRELNLTFEEMEKGLENFKATSMRLEFIKKNKFTIINDSYNANPDSMKAALDVLKNYSSKRKIAILGTMGELGSYAKEAHTEVSKYAKIRSDMLLTTGEYKECYKEGYGDNCLVFEDKKELIKNLKEIIQEDDVILIKASRNAKFEEIIDGINKIYEQIKEVTCLKFQAALDGGYFQTNIYVKHNYTIINGTYIFNNIRTYIYTTTSQIEVWSEYSLRWTQKSFKKIRNSYNGWNNIFYCSSFNYNNKKKQFF
eukprot:TRINITY_DN1532_c0_g1_i2.p2 TRINITY_DN1532_c0_g1~~TRINITY_DN1532_c0_g1_i2.p2  ORF type:complete len:351 (+),score=34.39 TRINITY_DN1532_c0_g1_i2:87-1055(+)